VGHGARADHRRRVPLQRPASHRLKLGC
jgi:hypothetical protein